MTSVFWQGRDLNSASTWRPRTDVVESDQGYELDLDLPGVAKETLDIQVVNDTVTVKGERAPAATAGAYHRVERPYGKFERVFWLPEFVNQQGIEAKLSDGVLKLYLPKREETKPKQITVQVQ